MVLPSAPYRKWQTEQSQILISAIRLGALVKVDAEVTNVSITMFAPDRRASDLTNKAESIMDLLVDVGILKDDNWFIVPSITLTLGGVDKDNPRAEVTITYGNRQQD